MTISTTTDMAHLPSIWAEARLPDSLHHEQNNINQTITRAEADTIAHNSVGPIRRTTHEAPVVAWQAVHRPQPDIEQPPESAQQHYSTLARSKSSLYSDDHLSNNYNLAGRSVYTPDPNPVVINRVV